MGAENPGEVDNAEHESDQEWSENGELDQVGTAISCTPTHAKKAPMPEIARKSNSRTRARSG